MFLLFLLSALDPVNGDFFSELIEKHCDRLKGYVYSKVNNEQDSEDIVQDIFLKVYRYIDKFAGLSDDDVKRLLITYAKSSVADFYSSFCRNIQSIYVTIGWVHQFNCGVFAIRILLYHRSSLHGFVVITIS